jgi:hypothetical protein
LFDGIGGLGGRVAVVAAGWAEVAFVADLHLHFGQGDPFILQRVVPREAQRIFAVDVDVLTVRVPPAALVAVGAVGVAQILHKSIDGLQSCSYANEANKSNGPDRYRAC